MASFAQLAMGAAPVAGGALLTMVAGRLKTQTPDFRAMIKEDQDLLKSIPEDQVARRAELQRTIDVRIDDLVAAMDRNRSLRDEATSYKGNWRDVVLFVCVVLFAVIWWNVPHSRTNWLATLIVLMALAAVTAIYAARGLIGSLRNAWHGHPQGRHEGGN
jgi:anti-sigma-K factor RskA